VDNVELHHPNCAFGPSRPVAVLLAAAALLAATTVLFTSDRPGKLLLSCVAIALAAIAISDLVLWPRLSAGEAGIRIFTPTVRTHLSWADIDVIRVDERSHHGLASRALEIESGDTLIVFSKRSLGRDPRDVFLELHALRPDGGGR
jgi:hypothetical protein